MTIKEMGSKRLFVGNLYPEVNQEDLEQRFSKFGSVAKIEIKNKKDIDGKITQTFAFIDIGVTDSGLSQCISTLANKKWKGYQMSVQQARESFMERLARERKEREAKETDAVQPVVPKEDEDKTSKAVKRSFNEEDDFKIVNNKVPKRDYTEEREEFKGFGKKINKEQYDPLKLFKSKLAGETIPEPVEEIPNTENMGKTVNGIVMFENEEAGHEKLLAVNKVYHSSSEEDEEVKKQTEKKLKKKKVKDDIKSAEFKDKMTKRFLEKQKATKESLSNSDVQASKKEGKMNKSKYYEDTSDEEEPEEISGKTGTDVLKTFQSFSNFWQDSDNEDEATVDVIPDEESVQAIPVKASVQDDSEDEESDDSENEESDDSESEESENNEMDESEVPAKEAIKLVSDVSMPRYDPTSENHEQFLRSNDTQKDEQAEEASDGARNFFEVKTDLKKVFGSESKETSGFSFGFGKDGQTEDVETKKGFSFGFGSSEVAEAAADVDSDGEDVIIPQKKDDTASKFGLLLKGKGVPKSENTFFFVEEDPRLEEGLSYFFDSKIDLDQLRVKYNERRPILSDILKKRSRNKAKRNEGSKNAFGKKKSTSWQTGGKRKKFNH
eukprot:GFUD01004913.1.p1 GENE.GFUD01004913.1~~GFUD01004913.1.p1  ORF type:complete len:609 (+),score=217.04 GFUD01004913.1:38-1864(+)